MIERGHRDSGMGEGWNASNGKTATFCTGGLAAAGMALHRMKGGDEIGDQGRGTNLDEIRVLINNNPTDTRYQGLGDSRGKWRTEIVAGRGRRLWYVSRPRIFLCYLNNKRS